MTALEAKAGSTNIRAATKGVYGRLRRLPPSKTRNTDARKLYSLQRK